MPTKFQLITELYDQTVQNVTRSYESWTGFLRAACYNYKCPFDEQILIYAQRPDPTAVLEMERWNRRFGRWVNRGAKSIAVFSDDGQNCLKLYFDVSDTHASRFARPLPIWTMQPAFEPEVIETLEATFGDLAEKENLVDAVRSACHNAVADNITDYLQDLCDNRQDSLLEELDDLNMEVFYRETLEVSVAYMLLTRLGLRADDYFSPDEFVHVYEFNTTPTINALGIAASDIAEMGLREISRTVMQAQRDQFFANRGKSGYGVLFYPIVNKVEKTGTVEIMAKARDAKQINRIFERMGYPAPVREDAAVKKENARAPSESSLKERGTGARASMEATMEKPDERPSVRSRLMALQAAAERDDTAPAKDTVRETNKKRGYE